MWDLTMEPGQERMAEAILYVATKGSQIPDLGLTKIYKTLVIADILAQASLGETVTRWRYMHFKNGPVPYKADQWIRATEAVSTMEVPFGVRKLKRLVPHREPTPNVFSDEERNLLDMALGMACSGTADDVSEYSHALPAWRWSVPNKMIEGELLGFPYLITASPATGSELDAALKSLAEQGIA